MNVYCVHKYSGFQNSFNKTKNKNKNIYYNILLKYILCMYLSRKLFYKRFQDYQVTTIVFRD